METLEFRGTPGIGEGDLELEADGVDRLNTDIDWSMAAGYAVT